MHTHIILFTVLVLFTSAPLTAKDSSDDKNLFAEILLVTEGEDALLAIAPRAVLLHVVDDVKDGCMPNPSGIRDAWEAELRRFGFDVSLAPDYKKKSEIVIYAFGQEFGPGCFVNIETLWRDAITAEVGASKSAVVVSSVVNISEHNVWSAKMGMQSALEGLAKDHVRDFYLRLERVQTRFRKEYPKFMEANTQQNSE